MKRSYPEVVVAVVWTLGCLLNVAVAVFLPWTPMTLFNVFIALIAGAAALSHWRNL